MNVKMKRIVYLLVVIMVTLSFSNFKVVEAATVALNVPNSVNEGETITATVSGKAEQWNLTLKANGTTIASTNNLTNEGSEISISASGTYKTTEAGNVTFTLTGDYSYTSNGEVVVIDVNTARTVTVNKITPPPSEEPETPSEPEIPTTPETPQEPETPSEPETPTTPEKPQEPETPSEPEKPAVIEPNFTATNKTMYANGNINLRDSWTTSSNATKIEEGTEVTVTATSSNTVNGYVWYRVSYNGQTKYVAGYLLTDKKPEEEKSNNANLKSLTVEGQELLPEFSSDVTSYSMNVTTDVDKLEIKAEAEDEKATVDIKGNTELKDGDNTVTISVSAEDGTVKIYEIKVTRADEIPLGLKTLKIEGTDIHKTFKADVFEYEIEVEELEGLNIEAIANDEKASVEILESVEGDVNNITIMVKSEDGEETVTYQVTAKKVIVVTEEPAEESTDPQIFIYIGIIVVAGAALIGVLVYFIKNRNTQKIYYSHSDYEDEEDFEGFPEELPEKKMFEDEDEDNNSDPFRRRGKHF